MSGNSFSQDCPCCQSKESMSCSNDCRPHEMISGVCLVCGYQYYTELGFVDKETLDELRKDNEYTPIPITEDMKKNIEEYTKSYNLEKF